MTIKDELAAELKDALKAKDRARLDVIRQINTEATKALAEPGFHGEADDTLYQRIITGYTKKMEKARIEYEGYGDRGSEMAAKLAFETDYLARWLPEGASEDEIRALVETAIAEVGAGDPGQAGRVTGHVMKQHQGLDGGMVNRIARELLGA